MTGALAAPLLTYAMRTTPDPLLVSAPATNPSLASFTFVVSCARSVGSCTVGQLAIHLPVGDAKDPTNLTSVPPTVASASISSSDGALWTPALGLAAGLFLFTPPAGSATFADQSLTIVLSGIQMSTLVGTAEISILEWASPGSTPAPPAHGPPTGEATIPAAKFPEGFEAFGFHPNAAQVDSGGSVTLTWVGSTNADFSIKVADQPATPVTGRSWVSPPLYTATIFTLIASATDAGQTVSLEIQAIVTVANPQVLEFSPVPDQINVGQEVVLHWRTVNADGAYLWSGESSKQALPAVSDPNHPVKIAPKFGRSYTLQAFRHQAGQEVLSAAVPLSFTFAPVDFVKFSADPPSIDATHTSTTLSWTVENTTGVSFQGAPVAACGRSLQSPTADTTYELVATWLDGTPVSAPPVLVSVKNVRVRTIVSTVSMMDPGTVAYEVVMTVENATSIVLTCPIGGWAGPMRQSPDDPTLWIVLAIKDGNAPPGGGAPIPVDYVADGFLPVHGSFSIEPAL